MARHIWSVVCGRGVLDKYTGQVSIFDVIEQVTINRESAAEIQKQGAVGVELPICIVSLWHRSDPAIPERVVQRVEFTSPRGKTFTAEANELPVNLETARRSRVFVRMPGLPIDGEGTYQLVVKVRPGDSEGKWVRVAKVPVEVVFRSSETPATE